MSCTKIARQRRQLGWNTICSLYRLEQTIGQYIAIALSLFTNVPWTVVHHLLHWRWHQSTDRPKYIAKHLSLWTLVFDFLDIVFNWKHSFLRMGWLRSSFSGFQCSLLHVYRASCNGLYYSNPVLLSNAYVVNRDHQFSWVTVSALQKINQSSLLSVNPGAYCNHCHAHKSSL